MIMTNFLILSDFLQDSPPTLSCTCLVTCLVRKTVLLTTIFTKQDSKTGYLYKRLKTHRITHSKPCLTCLTCLKGTHRLIGDKPQ